MSTLATDELQEHLMLTLTVNIRELYMAAEDWTAFGDIYAQMERQVHMRARELGAEIAFGPAERSDGDEHAELLTFPLVPEGKLRSEVVSCAPERCSCVWHRVNEERSARPEPAPLSAHWAMGW